MKTVTDEYIKRAMRLNRVSQGEALESAAILNEAHEEIAAVLLGIGDSPDYRQINQAQAEITRILGATYAGSLVVKARTDAATILAAETNWNVTTIAEFTDEAVVAPVQRDAVRVTKNKPFQGKTFSEWFRREGATEIAKINSTLSAGYLNGTSLSDLYPQIEGIMNKSSNHIKTLTRSNIMNTSSIARDMVFAENADLLEGKRWVSVLDIRTTPHICGVRDQKKYTLDNEPIGHTLEWGAGPSRIHFNCRSVDVPWIKGEEETGDRPSVGAGEDYERGDNVTQAGTVRKRNPSGKDIYDTEIVTTRTKYEGWLRSQPTDFVADALGSMEEAQAFKAGESLFAITKQPLGTPIGIGDL